MHFTLTTFVFYFSPYFHFLDYFEILHFIFIFFPHTRPWQLCSLLGMSFLWWRLPAAPDKSSYPAQCRRNHSFANHVWPRSCTSHVFSRQDPKTTFASTYATNTLIFLVFVWWEQGRHKTWDRCWKSAVPQPLLRKSRHLVWKLNSSSKMGCGLNCKFTLGEKTDLILV